MKKVLIVTHGNLPLPNIKGGAVEKLVQYIVGHNEKEKDFDLTLLSCYDKAAEKLSRNYKNTKFVYIDVSFSRLRWNVNRILYKLFKYPLLKSDYTRGVQHYLRKNKQAYDIVVFENNPQFIVSRMPQLKALKIFHIHNDWFSDKQMNNALYKNKFIAGAAYFDRFFCVSPYIKTNIDKYIQPDKSVVIRNGVDSLVDKDKKDGIIAELIAKFGIKPNDFVFMYSGRLVKEKGCLQLLQAFISTCRDNFKLLIVGGADYNTNINTDYVSKLKEIASCDDRIIFTGYIASEQMPYYNMISNVVVIPTYEVEEAASLTAIEAVHEKNVLIVSDSGHLKWWGEQECAILVRRGKDFVPNLAMAMENIGMDKELYQAKRTFCSKLSDMHTSIEFYNQMKANFL